MLKCERGVNRLSCLKTWTEVGSNGDIQPVGWVIYLHATEVSTRHSRMQATLRYGSSVRKACNTGS